MATSDRLIAGIDTVQREAHAVLAIARSEATS